MDIQCILWEYSNKPRGSKVLAVSSRLPWLQVQRPWLLTGISYGTEGSFGSRTTCFVWRRKFQSTCTKCRLLTQSPVYSEPCWLHGLPALQEMFEKCLNSSYSGSSCCKEAHFTQKIPCMLWKVMQTAQI